MSLDIAVLVYSAFPDGGWLSIYWSRNDLIISY